jgi:hypothetical protein
MNVSLRKQGASLCFIMIVTAMWVAASGRGALVSPLTSSKTLSAKMVNVYQLNLSIEIYHQYSMSHIEIVDNIKRRTGKLIILLPFPSGMLCREIASFSAR